MVGPFTFVLIMMVVERIVSLTFHRHSNPFTWVLEDRIPIVHKYREKYFVSLNWEKFKAKNVCKTEFRYSGIVLQAARAAPTRLIGSIGVLCSLMWQRLFAKQNWFWYARWLRLTVHWPQFVIGFVSRQGAQASSVHCQRQGYPRAVQVVGVFRRLCRQAALSAGRQRAICVPIGCGPCSRLKQQLESLQQFLGQNGPWISE